MGNPITCLFCDVEFIAKRPNNTCCGARKCKAKRQNIWRKSSDQPYYVGPRRRQMLDWLDGFKSGNPCLDCGGYFPVECMDFDHTGNDKIAGVSYLINSSASFEDVMMEVAKCELVCANCHRTRTRMRFMEKRDNNDKGKWETL